MKKQPIPGSLRLWQLVVFLIAPVLCALVCLCIGRMNVPVRDLVSLLLGREVGAQARAVLWSMRLPRVLLAALVGAGLNLGSLSIEDGTIGTVRRLQSAVDDAFGDADETDLSILYLCTHGVLSSSDDGQVYLMLGDGENEAPLGIR